MSTATMMSNNNHNRRFLFVGPPNKRKERDGFYDLKPSASKLASRPGSPAPTTKPPEPDSRNELMAGYLAHEFLTKGTLFGQPWDPARAEAVPVSADSKRPKPEAEMGLRADPQVGLEKDQRYVEVADLLKTDGTHLPGIVNPTQLARFLQL